MTPKVTLLLLFGSLMNWNTVLSIDYGDCTTPNRERAKCIPLQDCQQLYNLVQSPNLSDDGRAFLKNSQCGYVNQQVLICCSDRHRTMKPPVEVTEPTEGVLARLPDPPACGRLPLSDRIFGGNVTSIDEFPWMALIAYTKPGNVIGHHCGGTLISDRYVVTAAHCVVGRAVPADWRLTGVRLGEWDTKTNPDCEVDPLGKRDCAPEHLDVPVERVVPHPSYNPNARNQINDIALLRLQYNVAFSDFVQPICLPRSVYLSNHNFAGESMDIAGWGQTEHGSTSSVKLKAQVSVWSLDECRRTYMKQGIELNSMQLCAGGVQGVDSCRGDSGGPMMMKYREENRDDAFYLTGIVSFGPTPCGLRNWPGVYTRVGAHVSWIENNVLV